MKLHGYSLANTKKKQTLQSFRLIVNFKNNFKVQIAKLVEAICTLSRNMNTCTFTLKNYLTGTPLYCSSYSKVLN